MPDIGSDPMNIEANLSKPYRILYVVAGLAMIAVLFSFPMPSWLRVVIAIGGALSILGGACGL